MVFNRQSIMASRYKLVPQRGEIFIVDFDPTIGSEIQKKRPALIIQNDISNEYSPVTIVAAISSYGGDELYPTEVLIQKNESGLTVDSVVLLNQIRTIDKKRLSKKIGSIKISTMQKIDQALELSLGIIKI